MSITRKWRIQMIKTVHEANDEYGPTFFVWADNVNKACDTACTYHQSKGYDRLAPTLIRETV
jgi:hypothetical protein